ncbi:MAG: asparaginase, partial [Gemmatimonadales bacterium]
MPSFVDVLRDDLVESRHVVSIAVVHADGSLRGYSGDPDTVAFWRSCAKP